MLVLFLIVCNITVSAGTINGLIFFANIVRVNHTFLFVTPTWALFRYRAEKWSVVTGIVGATNPLISTYDFMKDVIGYDLAAFFERNSSTLQAEIDVVLKALLAPEAK